MKVYRGDIDTKTNNFVEETFPKIRDCHRTKIRIRLRFTETLIFNKNNQQNQVF